MFVTAQKVGVGTKAPPYFFTVKDSLSVTNGIGIAQVSPNGLTAVGTYVSNSSAFIQTHTATDLSFATDNGGAAMVIQNSTGRLGIATNSPTARLDVNGTVKIRDTLKLTYGNPIAGQVLTCDAAGNAKWATAPGGGFTLPFTGNASTTQTAFALFNDQGNGISSYTPGNTALAGITGVGIGVNASANSGIAINAFSNSGNAAVFQSGSGLAIKTLGGSVEINGKIKIVDGTQANAAVLVSNGSGEASWSKPAMFSAVKTNNNQIVNTPNPISYIKINFTPVATIVSGAGYNAANSEFTAPVSGFYHFDAVLYFVNNSAGSSTDVVGLSLFKRDSPISAGNAFYENLFPYTNPMGAKSIAATVYLQANEIIDLRVINTTNLQLTVNGDAFVNRTFFSGYKVH